jgi:hypothetical protein
VPDALSDAFAQTSLERTDASATISMQTPPPLPSSGGSSGDNTASGGAVALHAVAPHPSSLPLTRTRSYNVLDSIPTDVCLQVFKDRVVFCVSQVEGGRVGHWFLCECRPDLVRPRGMDFVTTPLLGSQRDGADATEGLVYARQLCQELALLAAPLSTGAAATAAASPPPETLATSAPGSAVHTAHPTVLLGISLHASAKGRPEVFKALIQTLVLFYKEAIEEG